jgi:hypothetical protein
MNCKVLCYEISFTLLFLLFFKFGYSPQHFIFRYPSDFTNERFFEENPEEASLPEINFRRRGKYFGKNLMDKIPSLVC